MGKDIEFRIDSIPTEQSVGLGQIWITSNINEEAVSFTVASQIIEQKQNYLPATIVLMIAMTTSNLQNRQDTKFSKVAKQNSAAVTAFFIAASPKRLI